MSHSALEGSTRLRKDERRSCSCSQGFDSRLNISSNAHASVTPGVCSCKSTYCQFEVSQSKLLPQVFHCVLHWALIALSHGSWWDFSGFANCSFHRTPCACFRCYIPKTPLCLECPCPSGQFCPGFYSEPRSLHLPLSERILILAKTNKQKYNTCSCS